MGRAFSIWLYPGPGTGYMLMVACWGCFVALVLAASIGTVVTGSIAAAAAVIQAYWVWKVLLIAGVIFLAIVGAGVSYGLRNQPTAIALFASFFFAVAAGTSLLFMVSVLMPEVAHLDEEVVLTAVFIYCYLIIYLGFTRFAMMLFDRFVQGGVFLSALLSILLVLFGVFLPKIIQGIILGALDQTYLGYTVLQVTDPFWSIVAIHKNDLTDIGGPWLTVPAEGLILVFSAGAMLLLNLVLAAREVDRQREEVPDRVLEELRELKPNQTVAKPSSPWGDESPLSTE
jgi:hypothetical protein